MDFTESKLTEEYRIKGNLYGYVRIYHTTDKVQVDLSLYEKYEQRDELHIYHNVLPGKCPTPALAEAYKILADTDRCTRLWTESNSLRRGTK